MGINVEVASLPPSEGLRFPATSVESELGRIPPREDLLHSILSSFLVRRPHVGEEEFITAWEDLLAFRGEQVWITREGAPLIQGELLGLDLEGGLRLRGLENQILTTQIGEVSLRPLA